MAMSASAKIALVTGAGTGVGRAVAHRAWRKPATASCSPAAARRCSTRSSAEINAAGAQALVVPTDVSKREPILALFARP